MVPQLPLSSLLGLLAFVSRNVLPNPTNPPTFPPPKKPNPQQSRMQKYYRRQNALLEFYEEVGRDTTHTHKTKFGRPLLFDYLRPTRHAGTSSGSWLMGVCVSVSVHRHPLSFVVSTHQPINQP